MTWPMTLVPLVPSARSVSMGPLSALVYAETVRYGTPCVRPSCRDDPFTASTRAPPSSNDARTGRSTNSPMSTLKGYEPITAYPFHDWTARITTCGRICWQRRKINVSQVFAGQRVGVKQVSEHIWLVTFMDYDLGYFDDETCRLEPIDNPFGSKLLPMSPE